jgi:very-short-patch-repair endonuclease
MFEHAGQPAGVTSRAKGLRRRMTWSEQALWKELRKLDVNFRRQAPIGRYVTDFASHGRKLVIEVDGGVHERLDEVALRDAERQSWLEEQGYKAIRFTDRQVEDDVRVCVEVVRDILGLPREHAELHPSEALLLDGGGLGGGVASALKAERGSASTPNGAHRPTVLGTPPSPALPPSRRKGE